MLQLAGGEGRKKNKSKEIKPSVLPKQDKVIYKSHRAVTSD